MSYRDTTPRIPSSLACCGVEFRLSWKAIVCDLATGFASSNPAAGRTMERQIPARLCDDRASNHSAKGYDPWFASD
jgi:hypothetical protein